MNLPVMFRPAFLLFCTVLFCSTETVFAQGVGGLVPQISLTIPLELSATGEVIGSNTRNVRQGEPFPVYINVTASETAGSFTLTLVDVPQDEVFPTTLMIPALNAGETWSELYVGYGPSDATGEASYHYCQSGTQNCSPSIVVSYSPPAAPVVDVDARYGTEWNFTLSQAATNCPPGDLGTFPTSLSQEGNTFTSTGTAEVGTYTGIVDGNSYSLGHYDPDFNGGTFIDTLVAQYSPDPAALSGAGVWWWTNRIDLLCSGTYNIGYTPRSRDTGGSVPQISLTIPSTLAESTNEVIGSNMIDVKHGEPISCLYQRYSF